MMQLTSYSEKNTLAIGKLLAGFLAAGDVVCLFGQLGSGKTVFAKGIAWGLGIAREDITSPTFVLIRQHLAGRLPLYHLDLYRLDDNCQIAQLGYEEYFCGEGACVVEWADRLGGLLPKEYLKVTLKAQKSRTRKITLVGVGRRYQALISSLKDNIS
jgi:tRNA threonylcarbamoyladenosine biosynthesis protein TsaE